MPIRINGAIREAAIGRMLTGETMASISRDTGIHPDTLKRWRDSNNVVPAVHQAQRAREINLGEKIAQLLEANLEALTTAARQLGNPAWLRTQSASDIIDVYNAVGDRTIQILASVQPTAGSGADSGAGAPHAADPPEPA